ncbi:ABC-2 family transporter protein [Bythopirellula goksoeyrii]|uniref:ABC-2 family transporter protein n=1 Tax=Bythopirellula goksoeyrii TaxID=1400387 RepID=A0A5B9QCN0_9BACT|nr:ABC-2 family transporter protein [Bythopirellula goksoeyrii]
MFWFESRRAMTFSRLLWWGTLTLFPSLIIGMIRMTTASDNYPPGTEVWTVFLFALVPMLVSMLGTFLWATPAISSELERKSWVYLAVRPHGTPAVLLGKYLATVAWVLSSAVLGLLLAVAIVPFDRWEIVRTILPLTLLSCPAYGALYLLLGTLFPKRAMVMAVAYTLIFELIVSMIPALINTITVQFRLRTLLFLWADIPIRTDTNALLAFIGEPPAWEHVVVLISITLVLLLAAVGIVREREFSMSEEGSG